MLELVEAQEVHQNHVEAHLDDLGVSNYIADLVTFSQLICRT